MASAASRYGVNYSLDEHAPLQEHYISNDLQLGHLNCASPDGQGGAFVPVLGQGDIGHVDAAAHYDLLATWFVGCHGVRYDSTDDLIYFCDSCGGRPLQLERDGRVTRLMETGSRWLHDAVRLTGSLFLLTLADRNELALADVARGVVLAEWDFGVADGTIQFLSVGSATPGESSQ